MATRTMVVLDRGLRFCTVDCCIRRGNKVLHARQRRSDVEPTRAAFEDAWCEHEDLGVLRLARRLCHARTGARRVGSWEPRLDSTWAFDASRPGAIWARQGNCSAAFSMHPCMAPRAVRPGIYHATFTCVRRLYLLWPGKRLNKVIRYLAALTSERYGVLIHDLTAMSNHVHLAVGDQYGNHPEAFAFFESMLARQVNAMLGETGSVFEPYEVVELLDDDAILDAAGYVLANPVHDHLVEKAAQWRGVTTCSMKYGERVVIKRPQVGLWADLKDKERRSIKKRKPDSTGRMKYRGKPSELPDEVVLELVRPPVLPGRSDEEVRAEVLARVARAEDAARAERKATGRKVGNVKGLAKRHAKDMSAEKPKSWRQMFGRRPRHAGADELVRAAKLRDQAWDREYRERRQRLLNGDRESLWPEHTWKMRMYCGMACVGPAPKWPLMIGPLPPS